MKKSVLLEAKDKCEKLSVQTKKSKLESGEYKDTHTLIFNNIEKKIKTLTDGSTVVTIFGKITFRCKLNIKSCNWMIVVF